MTFFEGLKTVVKNSEQTFAVVVSANLWLGTKKIQHTKAFLRHLSVFTVKVQQICSLWVGTINMSTYLRLTIWSLLFDIRNSQLVLDDRSLSHLSIQTLLSFFQISVSYQVYIFPYHFFDRLQSIDSNHCLFTWSAYKLDQNEKDLKSTWLQPDQSLYRSVNPWHWSPSAPLENIRKRETSSMKCVKETC